MKDEKFAGELRDQLTKLGLNVWNPHRELLPGSNWLLESGRALERADGIVFVFSKDTVRAPRSRKEVEYAITQQKLEGKLVSVLLAPRLEIPWILNNLPVVNAARQSPAWVAREVFRRLGSAARSTTAAPPRAKQNAFTRPTRRCHPEPRRRRRIPCRRRRSSPGPWRRFRVSMPIPTCRRSSRATCDLGHRSPPLIQATLSRCRASSRRLYTTT